MDLQQLTSLSIDQKQALGWGSVEALARSHALDLKGLQPQQLRFWLDHTLLKPQATAREIDQLVEEAKTTRVASACVNSFWAARVAKGLEGSGVRTCAVIGFPLGAQSQKVKAYEAEEALGAGAQELDLVMNIGALKSVTPEIVRAECEAVVRLCGRDQLVKLILETGLLTPAEVEQACKIALDSGIAFVKTSTGFVPTGATVEMVQLMRNTVGDKLGVKASGGIRDRATALAMIEAGASRIGCSASLAILA